MPRTIIAQRSTWTKVAFGDVVQLSRERSSDPERDGHERFVGLEHIDPGDLKLRRWGNVADGVTFTSVFRPGQVLFGKRRAYQRKVAVPEFSGVCSGDIYVLEPKGNALLPELLPFICQTEAFFEHAVGTSAGSLSPRTNWESLASFEFTLPPIEEQRRIGAALRESEVARRRLDLVLLSAGEGLASYLEHAWAPKRRGWPVAKLGDLVAVGSGGTPSRSEPKFWNGKIPWVKTGEVDFGVISSTEESITEAGLANSAARVFPPGTVLMALFGQGPTLGRVALLGIAAATNQACACLPPNPRFVPEFTLYWLRREYRRVRALARGASQPNLNLEIVRSLVVPCPALSEQSAALVAVTSLEANTVRVQRRIAAVLDIQRCLLDSLC